MKSILGKTVGNYDVYTDGEIFSHRLNRFSKQHKTKKGYKLICMDNHTRQVHRVIAETFIPNPNNYPCINHKDCNPCNNNVDNLEWCTYQYNNTYGNRLEKSSAKHRNGKNSKKVYQYDLNGNLIKIFPSASEAGRQGFNQGHVSSVCRGNTKLKTYKGFIWSYSPSC